MRLLHSFLPALAGVASAAAATTTSDEPIGAEAYILRQSSKAATIATTSPSTPSIPDELARAILLQRLSTPEQQQPSLLGQLPSDEAAAAVDYINQFGKATRPLFAEAAAAADEPKQLVVAFSGVTDEELKALRATTSSVDVAFTSPRLSSLPAEENQGKCAFAQAIDPNNAQCWGGKTTQYLQYDATKDAKIIAELGKNLATLKSQAASGQMETVILVLAPPPSSSDNSDELRRRSHFAQEQVLSEHESFIPASSTSNKEVTSGGSDDDNDDNKTPGTTPAFSFASSSSSSSNTAAIPACFASYDACVSGTSQCSGHGECVAKWTGSGSGSSSSEKRAAEGDCYACRCLHTTEKDSRGRDSLYRWGGAACQKIDVSTPFWLFAGVTIALVGTVAFAVGLLFGVGEEKLPGVIGAGVSRGGSK